MKKQINPFASIVSWCLMPTHFHILVFVNHDRVQVANINTNTNVESERFQTFNQSLGVLLSSYTKAIQNQAKLTGSLFQKRTKAKLIFDEIEIEPAYWDTAFGTTINITEGKSYMETCVEYIHQNPVYSKLVKNAEDWEFSSLRDYLGLRHGKLIDYDLLEREKLLPILNRHLNESRETTDQNIETYLMTKVRVMSSKTNITHHPSRNRETSNTVIIGIGSNLEAETNIPKMLEILKTHVNVLKVSSMLKTKPIGIKNQPDFTNGAVKIATDLKRNELKKFLKSIEDQMGRDRSAPKFGHRNIDLDIVVWNGEIVDEDYYTRDFLQKSVAELL